MQIAELMRLIPDDGELSVKNNSGTVIISVSLYNIYCESMYHVTALNEDLIKSEVVKMVEKIKAKLNANS